MDTAIRTAYITTANTVIASNTVLASIGLTSPIAANQTQKIRVFACFNVGTAAGIKFQVVTPAGVVAYVETSIFYLTATTRTLTMQTTNNANIFTPGGATANRFFELEATIVNGPNAGNIDIQFAQVNSVVNTTTILAGTEMEVVKF